MRHPFEETIIGLTGLPPFHNYAGDYWDAIVSVEKLSKVGIHMKIDYEEIFDMCFYFGETAVGKWCVIGSDVYFEKSEDAIMFRLKFA
jgi:hypothetical protein